MAMAIVSCARRIVVVVDDAFVRRLM